MNKWWWLVLGILLSHVMGIFVFGQQFEWTKTLAKSGGLIIGILAGEMVRRRPFNFVTRVVIYCGVALALYLLPRYSILRI